MASNTPSDNSDATSCRAESVPTISSDKLLQGRRCLIIEHQGSDYVLRHTRNNRLILTKR